MKNLYSPSMLKSYLSCKYTIFNEVNEKKLKLKKIELSKNDKLRQKIARSGQKKYFKLFNETKISRYLIDISIGNKTSLI